MSAVREKKGDTLMCDYSLHAVESRPARKGEKLVSTAFANALTTGFSAVNEPHVAVCLLPGSELKFDAPIMVKRPFFSRSMRYDSARFRQINTQDPFTHHDALELPDGTIVLVNNLVAGQRATVLQLPVTSGQRRASEAGKHAVASALAVE